MKMKFCYSLLQTAKPIRNIRNASVKIAKYPVPPLHETLEKYLKSVKPFLNDNEFLTTACKVKDFGKPGGLGEELQYFLLDKAQREDNWLGEWWLNTAYLGYRNPVVVYSSPGLVFPKQKFSDEHERLAYASKLTAAALEYKWQIDNKKIAQEMMGKDPLDMSQYEKIFGTDRRPCKPIDRLLFNPNSKHIVVAYMNNFFEVCVFKDDKWMKYDQILKQLENIVQSNHPEGPPIGLLTTDNRDLWSDAYKELVSCNADSLKSIEEALFLLSLDTVCPKNCRNDRTTAGIQLVHGGGPDGNAANRWYDKTIQFIVCPDGSNGLTYEHSPAEGQPIAVLMDQIVKYIQKPPSSECGCKTGSKPKLLEFTPNENVQDFMNTARCNLNKLVDDVEFNCFNFQKFGKDAIKKHKLSPDSFLQMAMQYAFYKVHNTPGAHYESAATRKFIGGRTETIRSCSVESIRFAQAMCDENLSTQSKANALRIAVNAHKDYTVQALNARGVDRHLLGLKLAALNCKKPIHSLYSDEAFVRSTHMRISTSQVASDCDGFMVYGPQVNDGYACCYNPRKNDMNFGTSKFTSCEETDLDKFQASLESALVEMNDVLTKSPVAKL